MENFKDIEEALAAQVIAQTQAINENSKKGNALEYADQYDDVGGRMIFDIHTNLDKLYAADEIGTDTEAKKKAAINILNCTLFYMINRGLL